ncbi:hypothetical protein LNV23_12960 [Paucibacter sp. DJ1R-11]|uniref:hypothetical protein n=1 Tax=Paucibacter sp. DJ1R-11 TaxID=2893556 RepID=UPI0021E3ADB0|nr:hypothetical protein [Paucibacter sp. DJ1R-11]MCV2364355.1 hypothetical protein [Paucibacter sp. DJ1R-11]
MDDDFLIDLVVPSGLSSLAPLLIQAPFSVAIERQGEADMLIQTAVSQVAGFWLSSTSGSVQHYECSVCRSHPGPPEEVLFALSRLFIQAGLSHRIARIIIDLNEEQELISYAGGA